MRFPLKTSLAAVLSLVLTAPAAWAQSLSPVLDAAGHVFGYKEATSCVIWPVPASFTISKLMRHDKSVLSPTKTGYFILEPVAAPYAASLQIAGMSGWRLPTAQESRNFFSAFYKSTTPAVLQTQAGVVGTYWTSDETSNQAAAVRPGSNGPITQWYTRTGVDAFVWPVIDTACDTAGISPFSR